MTEIDGEGRWKVMKDALFFGGCGVTTLFSVIRDVALSSGQVPGAPQQGASRRGTK